jgi:diguanylate cyclase (GGDEF)-like protein/PAS domain S-box-containing protein
LKVVKHPDSETHLVPSPVVGEARAIEPAVASDGSRDRALLVAATQRARQVFQASPCGAVLIELDAVIVEANQAFEVLMGRSDFVGKHLSQVVDVAERGAIASHLDGLLRADGDRMVAQRATRTRSGTTYLSVSSLLLRAVDGAPEQVLLSCIDDSARHQHEAQLAFVSNHDMLTGLTNRHSFLAALRAQVDLCRRYGPDGALLLVSLDAFQKVNDTFGHAAGDALLIDLAEMLRDRLRAADVVARLGGDEFAVLLPRTNRYGALEVAQHIRLLVRTRITTPDGAHPVSACIGVS